MPLLDWLNKPASLQTARRVVLDGLPKHPGKRVIYGETSGKVRCVTQY